MEERKKHSTCGTTGTVLITDGIKNDEIVLTKRSKSVNTDKELFHISMNEGFSQTDKDMFGKLDLELCFKRGLLEELGITENIYRNASYAAFYDFFLEMKNFEIGLTSVLRLDMNFEKDIATLIGRDKTLETSKFETLELNKKQIKNFSFRFFKMNFYGIHKQICVWTIISFNKTEYSEFTESYGFVGFMCRIGICENICFSIRNCYKKNLLTCLFIPQFTSSDKFVFVWAITLRKINMLKYSIFSISVYHRNFIVFLCVNGRYNYF